MRKNTPNRLKKSNKHPIKDNRCRKFHSRFAQTGRSLGSRLEDLSLETDLSIKEQTGHAHGSSWVSKRPRAASLSLSSSNRESQTVSCLVCAQRALSRQRRATWDEQPTRLGMASKPDLFYPATLLLLAAPNSNMATNFGWLSTWPPARSPSL